MELRYSIVVCVHNALSDVIACLSSIDKIRSESMELIIVDDGSASDTADYLREYVDNCSFAALIRNDEPHGYTKAANIGVRKSTGKYVLMLNSDTVVPVSILDKLSAHFARSPDVGIVGPLSNAATWQSVPEIVGSDGKFAINALPASTSVDAMDEKIEVLSIRPYPRVPVLNGFCIMIRRDVIDEVGEFDEVNFPRGYGEENDFCFRATDAGYGLLVATDTYVFHAKSKSYGTQTRNLLSEAGSLKLAELYNRRRLSDASKSFRANPLMMSVRDQIRLHIYQEEKI